ncbi:helix-turn-helix domain-containing protein [Streptomyces violens]|uniref:helix-turn-helix domain-containing protein n=1 Tax=Streptomyces violens TaxID=66377 RepID=UPI00055D81AB|nr:helix-turn-helix transcriptional regulator [Streptomyces violens]
MSEIGIGECLARLRADLDWSQQQVADRYNEVEGRSVMTGKEIGRYERESRTPTPRTRGHLAEVFGIDSLVLDRAAAVTKRRRKEAQTSSVALLGSDAGDSAAAAVAVLPPSRHVLAADAAASAQFARFIAARNTDEHAVEQLDAEVASLARHFVSRPLSELYAGIHSLRNETFDLLRGRQRPRQTTDLYVTAGRLCGLSAHVCLDMGDYESAMTHARTAWACADAAGHNGLRGWVRGVESLITFWNGDPRRAAELAQSGQQYAAPGSIGVRLASLEARALAVAGDQRGAAAALATAARARDAMCEPDEMPGVFSFPDAKQLAYAGTTHLAIGGARNVQQAIEAAQAAVGLYRSTTDDDRSVGDLHAAHLDLARCHMVAGEIDATEAMIGFVLSTPPGQLSASIRSRLSDLAEELSAAQYRGAPQVAHLSDRIRSTTQRVALPAADHRSR